MSDHGAATAQGWKRFTSAAFTVTPIDGTHLWPLHLKPKQEWLASIVKRLDEIPLLEVQGS